MLALVRQTCLYVVTVLGDLFEEHVTIVGGLVPYLIIPQDDITSADQRHIGTSDLTWALPSVLDDERYEVIAERLRRADSIPTRTATIGRQGSVGASITTRDGPSHSTS